MTTDVGIAEFASEPSRITSLMLDALARSADIPVPSGRRERLVDRVTANLLANFTAEHGLEALPEDRRFEHFASYITVRQLHRETFHTSDIATGGGNDTGIDAIAILANGQLISDPDDLVEMASSGSLDPRGTAPSHPLF